jgi:predicted Na+-dependent transporter
MRSLIENNFGLVLLLSCAVGLAAPIMSSLPDESASVALAMLTYASCFKLQDGGVRNIHWRQIGVFYLLRYMALPLALFSIAQICVPHYALGIYLLALVPAAVSTPAFSQLFGGRVPTAFAIVILGTLLAPLMIPLQFSLFADQAVAPSPAPLFKTLAFCIFTPMVVYAFTRRIDSIQKIMYPNVKIISIILVAFVIALVVGKQRDVILGDLSALIVPLACTVLLNVIFMAFGFWFGRKQPRDEQITYATCSGFSNVALGVSLALLHFPAPVILLVAVSEIAWAMLPMMMKTALKIRFRRR